MGSSWMLGVSASLATAIQPALVGRHEVRESLVLVAVAVMHYDGRRGAFGMQEVGRQVS